MHRIPSPAACAWIAIAGLLVALLCAYGAIANAVCDECSHSEATGLGIVALAGGVLFVGGFILAFVSMWVRSPWD
jgi:hypothetical protein